MERTLQRTPVYSPASTFVTPERGMLLAVGGSCKKLVTGEEHLNGLQPPSPRACQLATPDMSVCRFGIKGSIPQTVVVAAFLWYFRPT